MREPADWNGHGGGSGEPGGVAPLPRALAVLMVGALTPGPCMATAGVRQLIALAALATDGSAA